MIFSSRPLLLPINLGAIIDSKRPIRNYGLLVLACESLSGLLYKYSSLGFSSYMAVVAAAFPPLCYDTDRLAGRLFFDRSSRTRHIPSIFLDPGLESRHCWPHNPHRCSLSRQRASTLPPCSLSSFQWRLHSNATSSRMGRLRAQAEATSRFQSQVGPAILLFPATAVYVRFAAYSY